jgi:hypothetical protein
VIRNETFRDGVCIEADVFDLHARTYTREELGVVVATRPMTDEEIRRYGPQPLDPTGAAATLNVVLGVWPIEHATNLTGYTADELRHEAEAWAVAGGDL